MTDSQFAPSLSRYTVSDGGVYGCGMDPDPTGDYVRYEDVLALLSDRVATGAAELTLQALDRMLESAEEDRQIAMQAGQDDKACDLAGEATGYRNARTYLAAALKNTAPKHPLVEGDLATQREIADLAAVRLQLEKSIDRERELEAKLEEAKAQRPSLVAIDERVLNKARDVCVSVAREAARGIAHPSVALRGGIEHELAQEIMRLATVRTDGHSALRVRNGNLERFDPHPESAPSPLAAPVFESKGGEFPGWCKHCDKHRSLHRDHPGANDGDPEWCTTPLSHTAVKGPSAHLMHDPVGAENIARQNAVNSALSAIEPKLVEALRVFVKSGSANGNEPMRRKCLAFVDSLNGSTDGGGAL